MKRVCYLKIGKRQLVGQQLQGGQYFRCVILSNLTYCFLRNLAYIGFRNLCDVVQPLRRKHESCQQ